MGQADWHELDGVLSASQLRRGSVFGTGGFTPPNGGGSFVFGYNSLAAVKGAHGMFCNLPGFIPTGDGLPPPAGGGIVLGAVKRVASPGSTGMSAMLFFCGQGSSPSVNDSAYLLGLSDADPYEIVLAKAPIVSGLVEADENVAILARSSAQYNLGDDLWHHLELEVIVEPNGDVKLQVQANDLALYDVTSPVWAPVAGIDAFIDDNLYVNTGSAPLWGGHVGWAFSVNDQINRRGAFDAIQCFRVPG
jgi:hypothetical protein